MKMNGVKGLVYKELRLRRKTALMAMTTWLLFFILTVSICLSMDFGNLANSEVSAVLNVTVFNYALAAIAMLSLINGGDAIYSDAKCHWDRFEYTLPISAKKIAAVKVSVLGAAAVLSLCLSLLSSWVILTLSHRTFDFAVFKNITALMLLFMIITVVSTVLMIRYKNPQAVSVRLFGSLMVLYIPFAAWLVKKMLALPDDISDDEFMEQVFGTFSEKFAEIRDMLFPFSALIFAAIILAGYFLFTKQLERRET